MRHEKSLDGEKFIKIVGLVGPTVKMTGEFRAPKRGEFYLSGAIPEAYEAPNDLSQEFYIMERVKPPAKILCSKLIKSGYFHH